MVGDTENCKHLTVFIPETIDFYFSCKFLAVLKDRITCKAGSLVGFSHALNNLIGLFYGNWFLFFRCSFISENFSGWL